MKNLDDISVLLIQIRPDIITRDHEFTQVVKHTGLQENQFKRLNALEDIFSDDLLEGIDVLVIGGSGDYLISKGDIPNVIDAIGKIVKKARKKSMPTLGICFGAQILTKALGGHVDIDLDRAETGSLLVTKKDTAKKCPILADFPTDFLAQLGHKDHLIQIPEGAVSLMYSNNSDHQVYTFPGEPIYALVFHPELDEEAIVFRLNHYAKEYNLAKEPLQKLCATIKPTPIASSFLRRFFTEIVSLGKTYPVDEE